MLIILRLTLFIGGAAFEINLEAAGAALFDRRATRRTFQPPFISLDSADLPIVAQLYGDECRAQQQDRHEYYRSPGLGGCF